MGAQLGYQAKLYYKEGGRGASGDWTLLDNVRDLTLNLEKTDADATTRGNNGWKASLAGLKDGSVEFEQVWDTSETGFKAIHDSFFNDVKIGLAIMDGAIATGTGLQGDFAILNLTSNQPLEDTMTAQVTAKLTYSVDDPIWVDNGSEPTGTDTY